jgi:hypothetical protein
MFTITIACIIVTLCFHKILEVLKRGRFFRKKRRVSCWVNIFTLTFENGEGYVNENEIPHSINQTTTSLLAGRWQFKGMGGFPFGAVAFFDNFWNRCPPGASSTSGFPVIIEVVFCTFLRLTHPTLKLQGADVSFTLAQRGTTGEH